MSVYITSAESKLAAKWMSDLDKSRRSWIWKRWVILVLAAIMLTAVLILTLGMKSGLPTTRNDHYFENSELSPKVVKSYVDERYVQLSDQMFVTIQIFIWGTMGVILVLGCLLQWNRHSRDALIIKILRQELENEVKILSDDTERPLDILLVEDNPGDAFLTKEALSEGNIRVNFHVAVDGDEAMNYLHKKAHFTDASKPDLVLLDIHLPRKDGREVLREIKSDEKLVDIPVVLLTASHDEQELLAKHDLPTDHYLVKPVELTRFIGLIKSIEELSWAIRQIKT